MTDLTAITFTIPPTGVVTIAGTPGDQIVVVGAIPRPDPITAALIVQKAEARAQLDAAMHTCARVFPRGANEPSGVCALPAGHDGPHQVEP